MKILAFVVGLGLFVCSCATTEGELPSAASASFESASAEEIEIAAREGYDPNAVRCERESVLGSRLPARQVCRPEWEWRAIARGAQETAEHLQRLGVPGEPCDPC